MPLRADRVWPRSRYRERAALVAEQLGRQQLRRQGGAINLHERRGSAARLLVDEERQRVFAHTRFTRDKNVGIRRRNAACEPQGLAHRLRVRYDFDHLSFLKSLPDALPPAAASARKSAGN